MAIRAVISAAAAQVAPVALAMDNKLYEFFNKHRKTPGSLVLKGKSIGKTKRNNKKRLPQAGQVNPTYSRKSIDFRKTLFFPRIGTGNDQQNQFYHCKANENREVRQGRTVWLDHGDYENSIPEQQKIARNYWYENKVPVNRQTKYHGTNGKALKLDNWLESDSSNESATDEFSELQKQLTEAKRQEGIKLAQEKARQRLKSRSRQRYNPNRVKEMRKKEQTQQRVNSRNKYGARRSRINQHQRGASRNHYQRRANRHQNQSRGSRNGQNNVPVLDTNSGGAQAKHGRVSRFNRYASSLEEQLKNSLNKGNFKDQLLEKLRETRDSQETKTLDGSVKKTKQRLLNEFVRNRLQLYLKHHQHQIGFEEILADRKAYHTLVSQTEVIWQNLVEKLIFGPDFWNVSDAEYIEEVLRFIKNYQYREFMCPESGCGACENLLIEIAPKAQKRPQPRVQNYTQLGMDSLLKKVGKGEMNIKRE